MTSDPLTHEDVRALINARKILTRYEVRALEAYQRGLKARLRDPAQDDPGGRADAQREIRRVAKLLTDAYQDRSLGRGLRRTDGGVGRGRRVHPAYAHRVDALRARAPRSQRPWEHTVAAPSEAESELARTIRNAWSRYITRVDHALTRSQVQDLVRQISGLRYSAWVGWVRNTQSPPLPMLDHWLRQIESWLDHNMTGLRR